MGEQHLGGVQPVLLEAGFPGLHQPHLADGGGGLQLMHGIRAARPAQPGHALGHRAGGHHHDVDAALAQGHHAVHPDLHQVPVQAAAVVGEQSAANFDYPACALRHGAFPAFSKVMTDQGS